MSIEAEEAEIGDAVRVTVSGIVVGKNELTGGYVVECEGVWLPVSRGDVDLVTDGDGI